jgi:SAM-dependent methyltransferase
VLIRLIRAIGARGRGKAMDDVGDIKDMYDHGLEQERSRLERHRLEHDLTWRYLNRYLPRQGSILEIGAATGRYTLQLCRLGYSVTAVDLSEILLGECRRQLSQEALDASVRFVIADARNLRALAGTSYDAVLIMGPLYHLVYEADRQEALRQAIDLLRPGGLLFSAFLSRVGVLGELLKKTPDWIERRDEVQSLLTSGKRPENQPRGGFRGYFARVEEIRPLHEQLGIETLALAGIEPAISADDESYNRLEGLLRELWLELLFGVSADESIVGASRQLLYVGRKH